MNGRVLRVLRVSRNVTDLASSIAFYREALGFCVVEEVTRSRPAWAQLAGLAPASVQTVRLRLGQQEIELAAFESPGALYPSGSHANDLWFQHLAIVTNDMSAAYERLQAHAVVPISEHGPQRLPAAAGGVTAFKFRDTDGHPLELIEFPPDNTATARQTSHSHGPTLGVDHTAISVADISRSTAFYCSLLGLNRISRQVNNGPEQQALDALPDVAVEVTALQPVNLTPHLELLGYLTPRGRAATTIELHDIAADRLILQVQNLPALIGALQNSGTFVLAAGPISYADGLYAALMHDPTGHRLVLIE